MSDGDVGASPGSEERPVFPCLRLRPRRWWSTAREREPTSLEVYLGRHGHNTPPFNASSQSFAAPTGRSRMSSEANALNDLGDLLFCAPRLRRTYHTIEGERDAATLDQIQR